jgi:hypothetical protein
MWILYRLMTVMYRLDSIVNCFSVILRTTNSIHNCVFTMHLSTISADIQSSTECSILLCKEIL